MPYGYTGQNQPNQTVANSGVFSISDVYDLQKQGKWGGSLELIAEDNFSSGTKNINFTSIQESKYDVHVLVFSSVATPVESGSLKIRLYESGVVESDTVYQWANVPVDDNNNISDSNSTANNGFLLTSTGSSCFTGGIAKFYHLGNASEYSHCIFNMVSQRSGNDNQRHGGGVLPQASTVDGIQLVYTGSSNISDYEVKLYGLKQT